MELFRTPVPVVGSGKKIRYGTPVMLSGSCFSENIGHKLRNAKFNVLNNPFGIVFNPLSVRQGLLRMTGGTPYRREDLMAQGELWCSFDHHSRFSDTDANRMLQTINTVLEEASAFLRKAEFLFLTFGTAYVYELKATGAVVSNCHKFPSERFHRRRITVEETVTAYAGLMETLQRYNPSLTVVFTVSPIRHWKDGPHENQLSKATLLLAIEQVCNRYARAAYFPSYELMMDDLRDYRFYDEDMLHPSPTAINYIWNHFRETFFATETQSLQREVEKIIQASQHRPFNANTDTFRTFVRQQLEKIHALQENYGVNFSEEEAYFRGFLKG